MSEKKQDVEAVLATIIESASTNTAGYRILIHNDGSALLEIEGRLGEPPRTQNFPPGKVDTKTLRSLLTRVGDVSKIPTGGGPKAVGFATTTKISYQGKTSGDLQSISWSASTVDPAQQQADADLLKFVQTTETQLRANASSQPATQPVLATISNSTPTVRYDVAIHHDGSATATTVGIAFELVKTQEFPPETIDTKPLLRLLTEIGDVSRIPAEPCPDPIPPGNTATVISYEGKTSGDLQSLQTSCGDKALLRASEELWSFVQRMLSPLGVDGQLSNPSPPARSAA